MDRSALADFHGVLAHRGPAHEPDGPAGARQRAAGSTDCDDHCVPFLLLYEKESVLGLLNRRFVPPADWIFALGSALSFLGVGFAIWARYHIGKYWSSTVSLREGHELIRTGPYARIRHPIYTGMLLAVFGTALAVGRYRALFAFVIVLLGFIWKSKREEALLAGQFGAKFEEHRRHTGFFLPKFS